MRRGAAEAWEDIRTGQLTPSGCPDDDLVPATALAAQADVIITGDKDLLTLKTHSGVRIRTPR